MKKPVIDRVTVYTNFKYIDCDKRNKDGSCKECYRVFTYRNVVSCKVTRNPFLSIEQVKKNGTVCYNTFNMVDVRKYVVTYKGSTK